MAATSKCRSDQEWMDIITECRQSGLSDSVWCEQHHIASSTFYNAIKRLRAKACDIPTPMYKSGKNIIDLTSCQDVVKINVTPDNDYPAVQDSEVSGTQYEHIGMSPVIELTVGNISLKVCNGADPGILGNILRIMGMTAC